MSFFNFLKPKAKARHSFKDTNSVLSNLFAPDTISKFKNSVQKISPTFSIFDIAMPNIIKINLFTDFGLNKGSKIKIDEKIEGIIVRFGFDSIVLRNEKNKSTIYVPLTNIVGKSTIEIFD